MKTNTKKTIYLLAACSILILSNCQKPGNLKPSPLVDSTIVNAMYPVTIVSFDGTDTRTIKYEYDKNNHLVKYGTPDNLVTWIIGPHQVDRNVTEYTTDNNGKPILFFSSTVSFVYNLVNLPDNPSPVDIYNSAPTQVTSTFFSKNVNGTTSSTPGTQTQFENTKDGFPLKEISSDGGGRNTNFSYDAIGNLHTIEYVNLSGPRANALDDRVTVIGVDKKHTPFSSVKNFWVADYPQAYAPDIAWSFCKNNPTKITEEIYDANKNAFVMHQEDDFTYVYNQQGFPTQISDNITYYGGTTTHGIKTYNITYR